MTCGAPPSRPRGACRGAGSASSRSGRLHPACGCAGSRPRRGRWAPLNYGRRLRRVVGAEPCGRMDGVDAPLFTIPLWADLTAVGLGGIQGALFASGFRGQRRLDLLGVAIIGIVMGMGGGLIRDLLLNVAPATLQSNWYLITATLAALVGMLLANLFRRLNGVIVALDAVVIGMFGAFGTS